MGLSRNSARDIQERASYHVMATNNSSDIIGVGRLHFISSQKSQIRYMAVDQKYRRNGVGKEILYMHEIHPLYNVSLHDHWHPSQTPAESAQSFSLRWAALVLCSESSNVVCQQFELDRN